MCNKTTLCGVSVNKINIKKGSETKGYEGGNLHIF